MELLSLTNERDRLNYIEDRKNIPIIISNFIVCMTTIKKTMLDITSPSQIIVGTENGLICVIDQSGSKILAKFKIPTIPHQIMPSGIYDVDYKLYISGRDNKIYTIRNGELSQTVIDIPNKIVGMAKSDKSVIVGTIDSKIHAYFSHGKKNFCLSLPASIMCIDSFEPKKYKSFKGYILALSNLEVRIYNEKLLVHLFKVPENIFGMKLGTYGKDEDCLVLITETGSLIIKSLLNNLSLDVSN
jgi:Bardet-Biedl syndrome 1 protein